jgi:hypothetical protein
MLSNVNAYIVFLDLCQFIKVKRMGENGSFVKAMFMLL